MAGGGTIHVIYNGPIDEDRVSKTIALILDGFDKHSPASVKLSISSAGGLVHPGITLHNFLRALPAEVSTHNFGIVASSAVLVFLAGARRSADPQSSFAIHGPVTSFPVNPPLGVADLGKSLDSMAVDQRNMSGIIAERTSIGEAGIAAMLERTVFLDPPAALDRGLIHVVAPLIIDNHVLTLLV